MSVSAIHQIPALGWPAGLQPDSCRYQETPDELIRETVQRNEGMLSDTGALVVSTGVFTGRCPKDKFIVKDELTAQTINWNDFNLPIAESNFHKVRSSIIEHLNRQSAYWVRDCYACADEMYRMPIRVVTENPWASLFVHNMFLRPTPAALEHFAPEWTVLCAPGLALDPEWHGVSRSNAAIISFRHKTILIAGSGYTGEIKKGIFTVLNYVLPVQENVLSMHCSANMGNEKDTALFFGLSGTGKTTLSADPARQLIGDDEHGWTNNGIFNFEGGCYAKCIDLTEENEPDIFRAIRHGALVENTRFFPGTRKIDFASRLITENTRVSYPLHYIANACEPSLGSSPRHIFFLTCDAYGVLPPISKLNAAQAMYQFISGYTAKVAGTETGVTEPSATFSACFGAPFLPLHPGKYAAMLGERLRRSPVKVWLVNTGWSGGPYGTGNRIKLAHTRAIISAALRNQLETVPYETHPVFGFAVPRECPGVPPALLNPRATWASASAYDEQAVRLAGLFKQNFRKYAEGVTEEVLMAGPRI